ncbi:MAG: GGDEF domain-containing protein [Solirubrobacteraceae bacterium]|nr:GGDEF domain-containing protein [Patulibacter sp.]
MPFSTPNSGMNRQTLAHAREVRLLTGVVFLVGAAIVTPAFLITHIPVWRGIPAIVVGAVAGVLTLTRPAPAIGSRTNHVLLVAAWGVPILAYYGALPHAAPVPSAFTFTGALVAFRLSSRWHIAAHVTIVTVLLMLPLALGLADRETLVAVFILTPAIASLAAIVVTVLEASEQQGRELVNLSRRDPLTGLGNRRLLAERLDYEMTRSDRDGHPFALLALDLNGFKDINDTLGHAAGDELLVAVASTLTANVRAGDTIVRQGGDEFCVLLPATSAVDAERFGLALREALREIVAGDHHLTTGMGIAEFPVDGDDIDRILSVADDRLRADKAGDLTDPGVTVPRATAR